VEALQAGLVSKGPRPSSLLPVVVVSLSFDAFFPFSFPLGATADSCCFLGRGIGAKDSDGPVTLRRSIQEENGIKKKKEKNLEVIGSFPSDSWPLGTISSSLDHTRD